jgi:hypothetical protein
VQVARRVRMWMEEVATLKYKVLESANAVFKSWKEEILNNALS